MKKAPGQAILYEGTIHQFADPSFQEVIRIMNASLRQFPLSLNIFKRAENDLYLRRLHAVRWKTARSSAIRKALVSSLMRQGFPSEDLYLDAVRFRCIPPDFQNHPQARGLLCWHRDTYYANAACQINLWVPLTDCDTTNGMGFFPEFLDRPVANNSAEFDLDRWNNSGGFQAFRKRGQEVQASTGLTYPSVFESPPVSEAYCPIVSQGQALLFASRHLHGTLPNTSGRNRYSLELRFCVREDIERGDQMLSVDDHSRGSFLASFRNGVTDELCPEELWYGYQKRMLPKRAQHIQHS